MVNVNELCEFLLYLPFSYLVDVWYVIGFLKDVKHDYYCQYFYVFVKHVFINAFIPYEAFDT